jgi:hypothetical protein
MACKKEPKAPRWRELNQKQINESRDMPPALVPVPAPKNTKGRRAALNRADDGAKFASEEKAAIDRRQSNKEVVEDQKKRRAQP